MDKQQLEKDLKLKNDELLKLTNLKAEVLSDAQKKQKEQLEKDVIDLQKKLDELKAVEADVNKDKTTKETKELKENIENPDAYELIKWTVLEAKMKEAGKNDVEIKEFADKINSVIRKFLDKELEGFDEAIKNGMSTGIQFAMMEALTVQWVNGSAEFFDATATGLTDNGLNGFLDKITNAIGSVTNIASKVLGPLAGGGEFGKLAKKVQNMTSYVVMNKEQFLVAGSVPELVNPYKCKELLNNPIWTDVANLNKPETAKLFTLNSTEGSQLSDEEKKKLQDIANNQNIPLTEKTLDSIEKALNTADGFLDKRSFWQDKFASVFDMIRKPLAALGVDLLPSDILWKGFIWTALGVTALDAIYLKPKTIVKQENKVVEKIDEKELKQNIEKELNTVKNTPITVDMVIATSKKYNVPVEYLMAFMKNDSSYGTAGLAVETKNPGNVGNTDNGSKKYFETREAGVDAVWDNLKSRIEAYHDKFGKDKNPTAQELASGKNIDWIKFFGVYMTASKWPQKVEDMQNDLAEAGITNKETVFSMAA